MQAPIIVLHGTADDLIPVEHGRELAKASANARFIPIPMAGHNEIPPQLLRKELDRLHEICSSRLGLRESEPSPLENTRR